MDSIWSKNVSLPIFPRLEGDLVVDVLVVGGGIAGLLTAWNLSRAGVDCAVIEENRIMHGVSGRTTAKLTSQHGLIYNKLFHKYGQERAFLYWKANEAALTAFRKLAVDADCDYRQENSYLYATGNPQMLEREMAACEALKIPARWEQKVSLPFPVAGAICFRNQAQFHPLKFAAYISKGLKIYEQTKAISFAENKVQTSQGAVNAKKIIVATHFPILNKHGAYFMKLYQQRSYVLALERPGEFRGMYLDCEENGLSLRGAGEYLLLGGGGHRTGKPGAGWNLPEWAAKEYYPQAPVVTRWATQDCMTLDGIPYIGPYSSKTSSLYVATGFQKWGMTTSMVAAGILSDLIIGKENPYSELFSPFRSILHKQLLVNGADAAWNLIRPTVPRCPHLGCALRWNKAEHTWDCPCHGSRFDEQGKRVNNPANKDLK